MSIGARILEWSSMVQTLFPTPQFPLLRSIAKGDNDRLHKQAVNTLSRYDFIKPFRKKWRLTPKGERAIKYHAEKDAFQAKGQETAGL